MHTATENECSEVVMGTKHKKIMINYNLNSYVVLLAQFNQQNGRGSACSKCEKTRNSNKYVCVLANEQVMHIHRL